MNDFTAGRASGRGGESEIADAMKELDMWKAKVEEADCLKDDLTLEACKQQDAKQQANKDMVCAKEQQEKYREDSVQASSAIEGEILRLQRDNKDLADRLTNAKDVLESKRTEFKQLTQKLKFCAQTPDIKLMFKQKEDGEDEVSPHISGLYTITQKPTTMLTGGQALITFEKKEVASRILKLPKCSVSCEQKVFEVRPKKLTLGSSVKFAVQLDVSKKELLFSGVRSAMPPERIRDRLESSFSKPSRGGGEVEEVEYDHDTGTGKVTFINTGVADSLALIGEYRVDLDPQVNIKVEPVFQYNLKRFQTFCGAPERSVLLDNITDVDEEDEMSDMLEIFFQKSTNSGGEIESLNYVSNGLERLALFDVL
ncbi:hypothetical protein NHX12_006683 [Muraenolepis orangiensis]|uniref:NID domain-containing protein n=1 Tax=Muraenolepis orangiensis TaxID=630683 RepID=A0A9Q0IAV6_9TELE|nr:hypothetical protein NHX12_006683 [Muraenolepis orangiensis]